VAHHGRRAHHGSPGEHAAVAHRDTTFRTGTAASGRFGLSSIRALGSSLFGSGAYRSSGYGYGNGGYGYGNRGYGYGHRHSGYVRAFVPGDGWVLVPIRAIRHI
jgi:hypothetical protein